MQHNDFENGLLKIDSDDLILLGEVGFVATLNQDIKHVLVDAPKKAITEYKGVNDQYPTLLKKSIIHPTIFHNKPLTSQKSMHFQSASNPDDKDYLRIEPVELKKDQRVIVERIRTPDNRITPTSTDDYSKDYVRIYTYKAKGKKIENMPESGYEVEITGTGIIPANLIEMNEDNFKLVKGKIFPHPPQISDIQQGTFGDCFLLSTMIAILNAHAKLNSEVTLKGSNYFLGIMKQIDEFHTVVRLFPENVNRPVNIKVENSVYINNRLGETVHHPFIWPHLIEKAYAKLGIQENKINSKLTFANSSFRVMYGDGGKPHVAMKVLTGMPAQSKLIEPNIKLPWDSDINRVCESLNRTYNEIKQLQDKQLNTDSIDEIENYQRQLEMLEEGLTNSFKNLQGLNSKLTIDKAIAWGELISTLRKTPSYHEEAKKILYPPANECYTTKESAVTRLNNFARFIDKINLNKLPKETPNKIPEVIPDVFTCFSNQLQEKELASDGNAYSVYPYNFNTGLYSHEQMEIYLQIKETIEKGNLAVASTPEHFNVKNTQGLRENHAYAVIGVTEHKVKNVNLKFVKLVNPWARVIRDYNWKTEQGIEKPKNESSKVSGGEFEIELSEFQQYFYKLSIGELFNVKPKLENIPTPPSSQKLD